MIARVLATALAAALVLLIAQTVRLDSAQAELDGCRASITTAVTKSETRAATTGLEAVSDYVEVQLSDAPIIDRVVTRTIDVCLRQPARDLPVPAIPGGDRQTAASAQDDADRAWAQAVADDLATCAGALNVCSAQYQFHNANVGAPR